jgi:hypothetical protein
VSSREESRHQAKSEKGGREMWNMRWGEATAAMRGATEAERSYRSREIDRKFRFGNWNNETYGNLFCYTSRHENLEHGYPVSGGGCPTASICLSLVGYYHRQLNECRNNRRRRQSGGGSIPSVTNCLSLYPLFLVVGV